MANRKATLSSNCLGHQLREDRKNIVGEVATRLNVPPDEKLKVLIKKGPVSVETSLKELEENYASKPEWKVIEDGGVLSIPVEELRMENPPRPNCSGQVVFREKKEEVGGRLRAILLVKPLKT